MSHSTGDGAGKSASASKETAQHGEAPWRDEDFARISQIDAKREAKQRRKAAARARAKAAAAKMKAEAAAAKQEAEEAKTPPGKTPEKPAEPVTASPAATPARTREPESSPAPVPPAPSPFAGGKEPSLPYIPPRIRYDSAPQIPPAEKAPIPGPSAPPESPPKAPAEPRIAFPGGEPSASRVEERAPQAPVTDIRNTGERPRPMLAPMALVLLAAGGIGFAATSYMTSETPGEVPDLVSSPAPPAATATPPETANVTTKLAPALRTAETANSPVPVLSSAGGEASAETPDDPAPKETSTEPQKEGAAAEKTDKPASRTAAAGDTSPAAAPPQEPELAPAPRDLASAEPAAEMPEPQAAAPTVGSNVVAEVQTRLSALGYAPGPADGALRSQTRDAIRAFQTDAGLPPSGNIDNAFIARLRATEQVHWRFSG